MLQLVGNEESLSRRLGLTPRLPEPPPLPEGALRHPLKPHQREGLEWLQQAWRMGVPGVLLADDMGLGKTLQVLAFLRWLRGRPQPAPGPVLIIAPVALLDTWQQVRAADEAALVFIDRKAVQRALRRIIQSRFGLTAPEPAVINGEMPSLARAQACAAFQSGRGFGLMILGPRAAGMGLTLTRANHVIHLDRWWNPAVEDQCSDRVYRIGQDRPVTIHIPIAVHPKFQNDSFDWRLNDLLKEKRALSRDLVVPPILTEADTRRLLGDQA